ncbi:acyl carrier protein [Sphingobacterium spiritivorum]|uniref:acyl carrier protein n=1 Tax=Sphingobacterium spiritivorum TaxID=258 RepID=UPI003DA34AD4
MKKVFLWILVVIIVVVLGVWGYLTVRQSASGDAQIHVQSRAVVRISVDRMLTSLAKNALIHPGTYFGGKKEPKKDSLERIKIWESGWDIPANVYLFSMRNDPHIYYTIQSLKDKEAFAKFLKVNFALEPALLEGSQFYFVKARNQRSAVLFNQDRFVVAFGMEAAERLTVMRSLLEDTKNLATVESMQLDTLEADLLYTDLIDKSVIRTNFYNGNIKVEGNIYSALWHAPEQATARQLDTSSVAYGWLNVDFRPVLNQYKDSLEKHKIPVDTLSKYLGGYVDMQWRRDPVKQTDTIVTYDLDDNFEMSEKKEVREAEVPDLQFVIRSSPHLAAYLPEKMFYKFKKQVKGDLIALNTGTPADFTDARNNVANYFYLHLRADSWNRMFVKKDSGSAWNHIDNITLSATRSTADWSVLKGEIRLKQADIHALYQLF